jgi:putative lipoic acid-binding regulatory protein
LVVAILDEREFALRPSKNSAQGKYESHTITVLVHSDDDRKTIFETLKKEEKIKFVL